MSIDKDIFDRAKMFSDFLGFHIRLLFCATVAQIAAAIPISNVLTNWQNQLPYSPLQNPLELAIMLVFILYALTMYAFIIRTGFLISTSQGIEGSGSGFSAH